MHEYLMKSTKRIPVLNRSSVGGGVGSGNGRMGEYFQGRVEENYVQDRGQHQRVNNRYMVYIDFAHAQLPATYIYDGLHILNISLSEIESSLLP